MCYKPLGSRTGKAPSVHSPEGMATGCRYQAGAQLSSRPARPAERSPTTKNCIVAVAIYLELA
jgi:hypothetical protein